MRVAFLECGAHVRHFVFRVEDMIEGFLLFGVQPCPFTQRLHHLEGEVLSAVLKHCVDRLFAFDRLDGRAHLKAIENFKLVLREVGSRLMADSPQRVDCIFLTNIREDELSRQERRDPRERLFEAEIGFDRNSESDTLCFPSIGAAISWPCLLEWPLLLHFILPLL